MRKFFLLLIWELGTCLKVISMIPFMHLVFIHFDRDCRETLSREVCGCILVIVLELQFPVQPQPCSVPSCWVTLRAGMAPLGELGNTLTGMIDVSVKNINRKTVPEMSPRFGESQENM